MPAASPPAVRDLTAFRYTIDDDALRHSSSSRWIVRPMTTFHRSIQFACTVAGAACIAANTVQAQGGKPLNPHANKPLTLAVYGDAPYGTSPTDSSQTLLTPAFIASINADPKVDLVLHVGDIHSGSQFCTAEYDQEIFDLWTAFKKPLIYTPGDNEWTDCHKAKEGGHVSVNGVPVAYAEGDPLANLDLVRSIFFAKPGRTLGGGHLEVLSQGIFAGASPDGKYVENVIWEQSKVLFVTLNIPGGSNNDTDPWFGQPITDRQANEVAERSAADLHWLDAAFLLARLTRAEAVVIQQQADMWDRDGKDVSHIAGYEQFIARIAARTQAFGKPVLLFEGDSHHYRSDNPLKAGQPCVFESGTGTSTVACSTIPEAADFTQDAWNNHPGYDVSNFHRIVVHGSTLPAEWLRLTITPGRNHPSTASSFGPFSWERVQRPLE
jgi:hypothetical protein